MMSLLKYDELQKRNRLISELNETKENHTGLFLFLFYFPYLNPNCLLGVSSILLFKRPFLPICI